ncbi:MAG TPA: SpoIIE family protein phosphatase [Bryobacteraceae bacterium]|jgi:sigma-B regulation protein RsbU (phosphoserine phosphatase)|nr:SpoIIE family protein phosphatase [Bryobacteraceae bacterium]
MTLEAVKKKTGLQKVLVVDDQPDVREALRLLLKGAGYAIETAESPNDALAAAAYRDHDLIVVDMNYTWDTTSGEEGLRLLDHLRAQGRDVPIIAMTGWSTIELAVEAMHHGACDFVPKPWDNRHFLSVVQKHLNAEPKRARPMEAELAIARKVQRKLLPQPHFSAYGLDCECACLPAGEISGDLYDFFEIDSGSMAFLLGDICGKGIGAALLVANLQATIRGQRELARYPSKLMERVNYLFFESTRPEHYATLFFGVYDAATRTIRYVNCGHPSPVLLRRSGEHELLDASATVLGAFKERGFEEREVAMAAGDRVVLFSDGFSEAKMDEAGEDWAVDTILAVGKRRASGLAGMLASNAVSEDEPADDITVMDIRVL